MLVLYITFEPLVVHYLCIRNIVKLTEAVLTTMPHSIILNK